MVTIEERNQERSTRHPATPPLRRQPSSKRDAVTIRTAFTEMFEVDHPVVLAPMAGVAGGELAAAVSNAGGLGLVGGGYGVPEWLGRELQTVASATGRPWGAGLITWSITDEILRLVLSYRPAAVLLSFGDPAAYAPAIKDSGARLICQVQDLAGSRSALAAGADLIVAQGTEAGGHGGTRSTLPLVPAVVDMVSPTPVLAAGGIADGRGLAAALALGAQGVLLGTRFYATPEALGSDRAKARLGACSGDETTRTQVFDAARGLKWPEPYTGRVVRNAFLQAWSGREDELRRDADAQAEFAGRQRADDPEVTALWAGEGIDLISGVEPAGGLVAGIVAQAEHILLGSSRLLH